MEVPWCALRQRTASGHRGRESPPSSLGASLATRRPAPGLRVTPSQHVSNVQLTRRAFFPRKIDDVAPTLPVERTLLG
jgi:hypothetical protein